MKDIAEASDGREVLEIQDVTVGPEPGTMSDQIARTLVSLVEKGYSLDDITWANVIWNRGAVAEIVVKTPRGATYLELNKPQNKVYKSLDHLPRASKEVKLS